MYFVTHNSEVAFPFVQVNTSGAISPIVYTPPKPPGRRAAPQTPSSPVQPTALRLNGLVTSEFTLSRRIQMMPIGVSGSGGALTDSAADPRTTSAPQPSGCVSCYLRGCACR